MATNMASPKTELKDESNGGTIVVSSDVPPVDNERVHIPLRLKITAVLLVSAIGFGAHWSSGVTGAMKSTLKKVYIDTFPVGCHRRLIGT